MASVTVYMLMTRKYLFLAEISPLNSRPVFIEASWVCPLNVSLVPPSKICPSSRSSLLLQGYGSFYIFRCFLSWGSTTLHLAFQLRTLDADLTFPSSTTHRAPWPDRATNGALRAGRGLGIPPRASSQQECRPQKKPLPFPA